ncbi:PAS domain S-box protein [Halovenus sp. WSH3]|uniref:histidine kinase n=1 Tax=Halovenus carboxidivorans TaxID=2692199 RepID=A0A6B0T0D5_9EURY|nr:PAS domain-containing sensor histidine kinase [Halovenus carboxidivorans]MXR51628.1 PAS domain S-box protein [Halovenus carboxidivorans]
MSDHAEQFVGTLFRVLAEREHGDVSAALLDAYRTNAETDRNELAQQLLSDIVTVFDAHMETRAEVDVLVTAVERLLERYGTIIEATPVAICIVDDDGRIELWNDGAESAFGWADSEIQQQPYTRLCAAPGEGKQFLSRLEAGERLDGIETRHRRRDGGVLDVRLWAAPFRPSTEEFGGAAFVISDISEQKRREQRLAVLNRVLRHNIRNEVTVAQGHLEMLAEETTAETEHVRTIQTHLDRIIELSEAARRAEQLEADTETTELDIADLLADRIDHLRDTHQSVDIDATVPESAPVLGHELLPYALDTLLDNAIEHNDDPKRIEVAVTADSEETRVRIADNGPGLPPMERQVLTAEAETQLSHSTGVGLWLARWIVRNSEGTITVGDGPLGGTAITIRLRSQPQERTADLQSI